MGARTGERSTEAFFGRRRGKTLTDRQADLMDRLLPALRLNLTAAAPADLGTLYPHKPSHIRLEIGFGGGEHLRHRLSEHPDWGFIGVEPFVNGPGEIHQGPSPKSRSGMFGSMTTTPPACSTGCRTPRSTISICSIPTLGRSRSISSGRFVSDTNLDRFARVLKPGGRFHFASDIDSYVNWTLEHIDRHAAFAWPATRAADWTTPYDGWPGTRYEAKAIREGRTPCYLRFQRV
jgi:tRNA (guanine-N7-)-methyltransferase